MTGNYISDHDLERYYLGMVCDETELVAIEEHLICCAMCVQRADETSNHVDLIQKALISGDFDLEYSGRESKDAKVASSSS